MSASPRRRLVDRLLPGSGRVPVLRQLSSVECGAACLAMVLGYHGRPTSVAECRDACGLGRDGISARTLLEVARGFGMSAHAFALQGDTAAEFPTPWVAHWEFNHFVVVERWLPDGVCIVDPAAGRRTVTHERFAEAFTGVALAFAPGKSLAPPAPPRRATWRRFAASLLAAPGARHHLLAIALASAALQVMGLALPAFTAVVVDRVLVDHVPGLLAVLGVGGALVVLAQALTGYLRSVVAALLRARVDATLMQDFLRHLLSLPFGFFQLRTGGDLLMRLGSNSLMREILTSQLLSAVLDGSLVAVYLVLLVALSPPMGAAAAFFGLLQVAAVWSTHRRVRDLMERDLSARAEEQGYLVELVTNMATVKASGAEDRAFERWSRLFRRYLGISTERAYFSASYDSVMSLLRLGAPLALLWIGAAQVSSGLLSLGMMLALTALAGSFLSPLGTLVMNAQQLQVVGANLERIADVLDAEPEPRHAGLTRPALRGGVTAQGVGFRYSREAAPVLEGVDFTVEPGEMVAIVGPTGSGKSTVARLLLGFHAPTSGRILVDGVDLREMDLHHLRASCGVVLQESALFSGTIVENIALAHPGAPWEQIVAAARLACVHDEIAAMPMGYETRIAEGGASLSGGQRQRIALARALLGEPRLLILDEATSHLDASTEADLDRNLRALACTRIVIAHRLSTVRHADRILVLRDGRIIERGSHEELARADGWYARLVGNQMVPSAGAVPGGGWSGEAAG